MTWRDDLCVVPLLFHGREGARPSNRDENGILWRMVGGSAPNAFGRDFFVMVIKGPNARNDFHLVDSEEYFYQLKGDIKVRVRDGERIVDHIVREGETFFIPANVPHSPQRPPNMLGVVVERRRPPGEREHVIFYCENCGALVEDIHFDCADIVQHFSQAMLDFWNDDARRTCKKCGKKVEKPGPMQPF